MQSLSHHPSTTHTAPPDPAQEVERLEALLAERRSELVTLQEDLRAFKARYTQVIGSRLAELAEIERAIRQAENRLLGNEDAALDEDEEEAGEAASDADASTSRPIKTSLRKLFWAVAKVFHPDHAADEHEARRRHSIMAEASRAYREGDVDSLHLLLGDEELRSYCASTQGQDAEDLASRLLNLKEELRTVEFGIKRIRQNSLYQMKLSVEAEAERGRDQLAEMADRINRQIVKARHRLNHLG